MLFLVRSQLFKMIIIPNYTSGCWHCISYRYWKKGSWQMTHLDFPAVWNHL